MKDSPTSIDWYCAQIEEVLVDRIIVSFYTTDEDPPENYANATREAHKKNIAAAKFLRT